MKNSSIYNQNYIETTYKNSQTEYPNKFCKHLFSHLPEGTKILDVGCGNGDFTVSMLDLSLDAYGIDISSYSKDRLGSRFKQIDLQNDSYPYENETFDIVFSKSVVEHLHNPNHLIDEAFRILKPGGTIITMTPSWKHSFREQFYIDHTHVTPFIKYSLTALHELSGFKNIKTDYFYQLPSLWKNPSLKMACKIIQMLHVPYMPFDEIKWPEEVNKFIRFSQEVMLICKAKKL